MVVKASTPREEQQQHKDKGVRLIAVNLTPFFYEVQWLKHRK